MPIVAEQYRFVAGVDTHARTHTLAVIDSSSGRQVDAATFPATAAGSARATSWLTRRSSDPSTVLVSMEGTGSYGAKLREYLAARAFRVVEAPSPSRTLHRRKGKSDQLDANR
jgi:transposase